MLPNGDTYQDFSSVGVAEMNANEAKHEARVRGWRERVQECRSSGQSVKEWCAGHGVNTATFYRWEREVLKRAKGTLAVVEERQGACGEARFVELPDTGRKRKHTDGAERIVAEVETAKGTIRFYDGANVEIIRALWEVCHAE